MGKLIVAVKCKAHTSFSLNSTESFKSNRLLFHILWRNTQFLFLRKCAVAVVVQFIQAGILANPLSLLLWSLSEALTRSNLPLRGRVKRHWLSLVISSSVSLLGRGSFPADEPSGNSLTLERQFAVIFSHPLDYGTLIWLVTPWVKRWFSVSTTSKS